MKTTSLSRQCPKCQTDLPAHTNVYGDRKPMPGDIAFCIECFTPLQFQEGLSLKIIDDIEIVMIDIQQPGFKNKLEQAINTMKDIQLSKRNENNH